MWVSGPGIPAEMDPFYNDIVVQSQAIFLRHGANGKRFKWFVLPQMKAETRKAEFDQFTETISYIAIFNKVGGFHPRTNVVDSNRCRDFIGDAIWDVLPVNQLFSRTGTTIPEGTYYDAILFSPRMDFVRIRDEYLTGGESEGREWSQDDLFERSEYPIYDNGDRLAMRYIALIGARIGLL
ncbi:hypothetical protein FRC03_007425, partial [Tulasnella sp. 419]